MNGVRRPVRDNLVALVSLVVALSALGYNTWRNERTECNRNVRGDPHTGWAEVYMIGDLAAVMPAEVALDAKRLRDTWEADVGELVESEEAFARIDGAIDALRQTTLAELRALR
jgi:hypothetical protein